MVSRVQSSLYVVHHICKICHRVTSDWYTSACHLQVLKMSECSVHLLSLSRES